MAEKIEWEVLDAPPSGTRPTPRQLMQKLLGRGWRWKVGGAAALASMVLLFFAALVSMMVVVLTVGAILSLGIRKIRRWLHRDPASAAYAVRTPRRHE